MADIANIILRKDNYLVALYNQDILRLAIPVGPWQIPAMLTETLQWNLDRCLSAVFDKNGHVHRKYTRPERRAELTRTYGPARPAMQATWAARARG